MAGFNHWAEVAEALTPALEEAATEATEAIAADARSHAPVRSGELRDSIAVQPGDSGLSKLIVVGAPYGIYVEFGTRFMAAEPFLLPALETGGAAMDTALEKVEGRLL